MFGNTRGFDFHYRLKRGLPFANEKFSNLHLENLLARGADLTEVELHNSTFHGCDFSGAIFNNGDLTKCTFTGCNLQKTEFHDLYSEELALLECQMDGASFRCADIDEVVFHECSGTIELLEASAVRSTFTGCDFKGSDFSGTDLSGAMFYEGSIARALMSRKTWLAKTSFQGTDITDVCLAHAIYHSKADFSDATILPFIEGAANPELVLPSYLEKQPIVPVERRLPASKKLSHIRPDNSKNLTIYQGVDLAAKLYCADIEEFRRTR